MLSTALRITSCSAEVPKATSFLPSTSTVSLALGTSGWSVATNVAADVVSRTPRIG